MEEYSFDNRIVDILQAVGAASNIVITTHVNPDGDAIGSALGLWNVFRESGKTVTVINHSPTPMNLRFLSGAEFIHTYHHERDFPLIAEADVICIVDLNNVTRLENVKDAVLSAKGIKIVIDHHQDPQEFADIYALDVEASSTCEMIARLLKAGGYAISAETASALYTGIMTDTGSFRFPRTDAELHRIVAELIEYGADPVVIYNNVYNNGSLARSKMLGRALAGMELFADGQLSVITVGKNDFTETHAHIDDTEGFVQHTLSIRGVVLGILFVELENVVKVSLRSKGDVSALSIAADFSGGGHFHAAAARFYRQSYESVRTTVIDRAIVQLNMPR